MTENLKRIDYSKKFLKQLKKAPLEIKIAYRRRFSMFITDPFHPLLDNHVLTGDWLGYRSINITGNLRVLYKKDGDLVMFVKIDSHSNLYG